MAIYRADHVGSFLRPPALLDARLAHAEGRISESDLRIAEDRAILAVLDLQRQVGLDVYSDGEYRRGMWITGLPAAVDGFGPGAMLNIRTWRGKTLPYVPGQTGSRHVAAAGQNPPAVIVGKVTAKRRNTGVESPFLRQEWRDLGVDPDRAIEENVEADNAVIAGLPRSSVAFGLHMCRGNNRSRWF